MHLLRCHFYAENDHFTKTGSGQTHEKHSKREKCVVFRRHVLFAGNATVCTKTSEIELPGSKGKLSWHCSSPVSPVEAGADEAPGAETQAVDAAGQTAGEAGEAGGGGCVIVAEGVPNSIFSVCKMA